MGNKAVNSQWDKTRWKTVLELRRLNTAAVVRQSKKYQHYLTPSTFKNANYRGSINRDELLTACKIVDVHPGYLTGEWNKVVPEDFMGGLLNIPENEWLAKNPTFTAEQYSNLKNMYQVDSDNVLIPSYSVYEYERDEPKRNSNLNAFRSWLVSINNYENIMLFPNYPKGAADWFRSLPDSEISNLQYHMIKALCSHYGIEK